MRLEATRCSVRRISSRVRNRPSCGWWRPAGHSRGWQ
nr:MAG TPA: hypothetical protein [Caudoviricetes sp.]